MQAFRLAALLPLVMAILWTQTAHAGQPLPPPAIALAEGLVDEGPGPCDCTDCRCAPCERGDCCDAGCSNHGEPFPGNEQGAWGRGPVRKAARAATRFVRRIARPLRWRHLGRRCHDCISRHALASGFYRKNRGLAPVG